MLRIAVVEDDNSYAKQLEEYINRYALENGQEIKATRFPDGIDIVENYVPVWDIILLDIEMPFLDGMKAAERIREKDEQVLLIFITNIAQFAIQGYEVNALDYVLKPINYYAFSMKMRKACRILNERNSQAVILVIDGETRKIPVETIRYVEVADHRLVYHTANGDFSVFGTLRSLEYDLGSSFARCNQCYLVNLKFVDGIKDDFVILGADRLKTSRTRKKEFVQALSEYYRYGGR